MSLPLLDLGVSVRTALILPRKYWAVWADALPVLCCLDELDAGPPGTYKVPYAATSCQLSGESGTFCAQGLLGNRRKCVHDTNDAMQDVYQPWHHNILRPINPVEGGAPLVYDARRDHTNAITWKRVRGLGYSPGCGLTQCPWPWVTALSRARH